MTPNKFNFESENFEVDYITLKIQRTNLVKYQEFFYNLGFNVVLKVGNRKVDVYRKNENLYDATFEYYAKWNQPVFLIKFSGSNGQYLYNVLKENKNLSITEIAKVTGRGRTTIYKVLKNELNYIPYNRLVKNDN